MLDKGTRVVDDTPRTLTQFDLKAFTKEVKEDHETIIKKLP